MTAKLPLTFRVRQHGIRTTYVATCTDKEDIYRIERPGMPEESRYVGKMRIMPAGKGKQDGRGYIMPVMMGKRQKPGDAYWSPTRPITEAASLVEAVSVQRAQHPDGGNVFRLQLSYDTSNRAATVIIMPKSAARQLHAQLDQFFGRKPFG